MADGKQLLKELLAGNPEAKDAYDEQIHELEEQIDVLKGQVRNLTEQVSRLNAVMERNTMSRYVVDWIGEREKMRSQSCSACSRSSLT